MTEDERVSTLEEMVAGMESKLNQILNTKTRLSQNVTTSPLYSPQFRKTPHPFRLAQNVCQSSGDQNPPPLLSLTEIVRRV